MRVRLRFSKLGKVRFTSHRDVARIWERALRRAGLPVAYTGGFSPRPRLSFGLALPTGHESLAEYLDVELAGDGPGSLPEVTDLPARLSAALPVGMAATAASLLDPSAASLQEAVTSCTWRIEAVGDGHFTVPDADEAVARALASDTLVITRERKGRQLSDDVRPAIEALTVVGPAGDGVELEAQLRTEGRSVRPAELLRALRPDLVELRVCRTHQWVMRDGARREPLPAVPPLDATSARRAEVRAS